METYRFNPCGLYRVFPQGAETLFRALLRQSAQVVWGTHYSGIEGA